MNAEHRFVEKELRDSTICDKCGATLLTYADVCIAALSDACHGFEAIGTARLKFQVLIKKSESATDHNTTGEK